MQLSEADTSEFQSPSLYHTFDDWPSYDALCDNTRLPFLDTPSLLIQTQSTPSKSMSVMRVDAHSRRWR